METKPLECVKLKNKSKILTKKAQNVLFIIVKEA